jgi:hypothetical protein
MSAIQCRTAGGAVQQPLCGCRALVRWWRCVFMETRLDYGRRRGATVFHVAIVGSVVITRTAFFAINSRGVISREQLC